MRYKYTLTRKISEILSALPEKGMGNQHVNFHMKDGTIIEGITVFNCQEFESNKPVDVNLIVGVDVI
jgi:hypothetical protein